MKPLAVVLALFSLCVANAMAQSDPPIRLNHIQVIGSHNSYKEAIEPVLFSTLTEQDSSRFLGLEYEHVSLTEQLNLGLRKLELDIFYDPEGGLFTEPYGIEVIKMRGGEPLPFDPEKVMATPGFKVLHVQDIDFRSNCLTLQLCLQELKAWSNQNADHLPVFITFNAKDSPLPVPEAVKPIPFGEAAFAALDAEFVEGLGREKLLTPDQVRGEYRTIHEAIMKEGWPLLGDVRGKFIMILDEGGEKMQTYINKHAALNGRIMFVNAVEGTPESAIRIVNDPIRNSDYIESLVMAGYIVRTRADANTVEARTGKTSRREAAFETGAHLISTDYYILPNLFGTDYIVTLPEGQEALCNPVLNVASCSNEALRVTR